MADAILSTAGVFFTLAIIAFASFIVGMGIYGMADHLRAARKRGRSRSHHHGQLPRYVAATVSVAQAIVRSTDHRAAALLHTLDRDLPEDGIEKWRCQAELAFALVHTVDGYFQSHAPRQHVETLTKLLSDVVSGELHRCCPSDGRTDVPQLMGASLATYRGSNDAVADLLDPPPGVYRTCADAIVDGLSLDASVDLAAFQRNLAELLKSALAAEITAAMK